MSYQHILNLSSGFDPFGRGEEPARSFMFPGGEMHIDVSNIPQNAKSCLITVRLMDARHIMQVLLTVDALRRNGVKKLGLFAPYIPYARQDRVAVPGDPLSIAVMANLINSCRFHDVFVLDAHSNVTSALIENVRELEWVSWVTEATDWVEGYVTSRPTHGKPILLLAPDAGAFKKVEKVAHNLKVDFASAKKYRNSLSGELSLLAPDVQGRHIVVVDDICDGGGTFIQLANQLSASNYSLHLVVTHGIFSKGVKPLFDAGYTSIHTSDSWGNSLAGEPHFFAHRVPIE